MSLLAHVHALQWAIEDSAYEKIERIVARHDEGVRLSAEEIEAAIGRPAGTKTSPDYRVEGGVAVVPIMGVIAKYASQVNDVSMPSGTSAQEIAANLKQALTDPSVHAIMLHVESPGGTVDGVAQVAEIIRDSNAVKPITAFIDDLGASAAYWMASQASKVYATASAKVGSIGVMCVLRDTSAAAAAQGVKYNKVVSGKAKGIGAPGVPVTAEDLAVAQQGVDAMAQLFFGAVAAGRELTADELTAVTDGRTFVGQQAAEKGLVDGIRTYDQAMSELAALRPRKSTTTAAPMRAGAPPMKPVTQPTTIDADALRQEGEQATLARLTALEAAFPADAAFAMASFKAGHSVEKAKGEYAAVLQAKLDKANEKVTALEADKAQLTADLSKAKAEVETLKAQKPIGTRALQTEPSKTGGADAGKDPAIAAYDAKIEELRKAGDPRPARTIAEKHPEMNKAYIDATNAE